MSSFDLFGSAELGKDQNPTSKKRKKPAAKSTKNVSASGSDGELMSKAKRASKKTKGSTAEIKADNPAEELFDLDAIWGNPFEEIENEEFDDDVSTEDLADSVEEIIEEKSVGKVSAESQSKEELIKSDSIFGSTTEENNASNIADDIFAKEISKEIDTDSVDDIISATDAEEIHNIISEKKISEPKSSTSSTDNIFAKNDLKDDLADEDLIVDDIVNELNNEIPELSKSSDLAERTELIDETLATSESTQIEETVSEVEIEADLVDEILTQIDLGEDVIESELVDENSATSETTQIEDSIFEEIIDTKVTDDIFAKNDVIEETIETVLADENSVSTESPKIEEITPEKDETKIVAEVSTSELIDENSAKSESTKIEETIPEETFEESSELNKETEDVSDSNVAYDIFDEIDLADEIDAKNISSKTKESNSEEYSELSKSEKDAILQESIREIQNIVSQSRFKPRAKPVTGGLSLDEQVPSDEPDPTKKIHSEPIPIYISKAIREKSGEIINDEVPEKKKDKTKEKETYHDQMPLPNFDPLAIYKGMVRRWFIINRHTIGLFAGGLIAFRNALPKSRTKGLRFAVTRISAAFVKLFVAKDLRNKSFAFQLRRRLELMGPTYIKLGQILALREDILPTAVTNELKNLLDRLPEIKFSEIEAIIEADLGAPIKTCFKDIDRKPIGTASIAQTHFATTIHDERVVLKVVKPGIRDSILTDIRLLKLVSGFLQWAIPQYQPKQLIYEFCAYTEKEVDLKNEADHAEIFSANFVDMPEVKFPKIYREFSGSDVLCMEFMDGFKPGSAPQTDDLSLEERETLVENGAAAIIQMLYKDGFFHADLHPGNLMIMKGPQLGFIDLGMVGRFEDKTRRRMLYYFHALVTGDIEGATKYLLSMARVGQGGDPQGFKRAVADILRRYYMHSKQGDFSLGRLILNSLSVGGKYRVFFPVEMTLMVKALVTFEGVGLLLLPRLDIPSLSKKYVSKIFKDQFNPAAIARELMRGAPELIDMLVQLPTISADSLKFLEESINDRAPSNPLEGIKSAIIAGSCLVGGVLALIQGGHWGVYSVLFALSILFAKFGK